MNTIRQGRRSILWRVLSIDVVWSRHKIVATHGGDQITGDGKAKSGNHSQVCERICRDGNLVHRLLPRVLTTV